MSQTSSFTESFSIRSRTPFSSSFSFYITMSHMWKVSEGLCILNVNNRKVGDKISLRHVEIQSRVCNVMNGLGDRLTQFRLVFITSVLQLSIQTVLTLVVFKMMVRCHQSMTSLQVYLELITQSGFCKLGHRLRMSLTAEIQEQIRWLCEWTSFHYRV